MRNGTTEKGQELPSVDLACSPFPKSFLPRPFLTFVVALWSLIQHPVFQLLIIFAAILAYCSVFLKFGPEWHLPGNEAELFQSFGLVLHQSLIEGGKFPLWNPYIRSGLPFVADPMLYIYNPLISVPILLFGPWDGFKLALLFSFLLAGWGMWRLCRTLGVNSPVINIWAALLYVFAGQPAARFFQGQYLFVFVFAWIPWCVSTLFQTAKNPKPSNISWTVLSLAMLYFCGNAYYPFLMLFVVSLFVIVMIPVRKAFQTGATQSDRWIHRLPRVDWQQSWQRFIPFLLAGTLAFGLIAIQFFPMAKSWSRMLRDTNPMGSHNPWQVLLDYTSKDTFRPDAYQEFPAREEFYAYIGLGPFLALVGLPLAFCSRPRRPIIFLLLVLAFTVIYIDLKDMPWRNWYEQTIFLRQFRHLLRPLIFGSFAIILLGAIGLDEVWKRVSRCAKQNGLKRAATVIVLFALVGLMLWSVRDVYLTNRPHLAVQKTNLAIHRLAQWLRDYDSSEYNVRFNPNNDALYAILNADLRFSDVWYHMGYLINTDTSITARPIQPAPHYILQATAESVPINSEPVHEQEGYQVYRMGDSLPLAFSVEQVELSQGIESGPLLKSQVNPLQPTIRGPNQVEIVTDEDVGNVVVLLFTHDPGWRVKVDGKSAELKNVGGYLGVETRSGLHTYRFVYRPFPFYLGMGLSLLCLGIVCFMGFYQSTVIKKLTKGRFKEIFQELQAPITTTVKLPKVTSPKIEFNLQKTFSGLKISTRERIRSLTSAGMLFLLGLGLYLALRLIRLGDFPIYFFADEAVQPLLAEQLIKAGFRDSHGIFFPVYVEAAASRWTPLLSMYFHALTLTLFGKSIFVTRATSAVISLLAPLSVGLILKHVFKIRFWWIGALLLSMMPAWLLHSRTAFETVLTATFYACFLYYYLLYRTRSARYLYLALIFAAATFYSYSNGQVIILGAGVLLFLSDLPYHWQQRRTLLKGILLGVILALPLLAFQWHNPGALGGHLRVVDSYWYQEIPFLEKIAALLSNIAYGLSPQYWFFPNGRDLPRHRWDDQAHILLGLLPLILAGVLICLRRVRQAPYRALLLAAIATPLGGALLEVTITRALAFVIPASLFSALGLNWALQELNNKFCKRREEKPENQSSVRTKTSRPHRLTSGVLAEGLIFIVLAVINISLLNQAFAQSLRWFDDYGLYGMQYGAKQLFEEAIPDLLAQNPKTKVLVTSTWANGADRFLDFFFTREELSRVRMDNVQTYLFSKMPLNGDEVFVMTPAEYQEAVASPKFNQVRVEQTLYYPDGSPSFLFVRLAYVPQADAIFAAEKEVRTQMVEAQVMLNGQLVTVRHSMIDMGSPDLIFDGDLFTLMRGLEANPFVLEMVFPEPQSFSKVQADFGLAEITLTAFLYPDDQAVPLRYETKRSDSESKDPLMVLDLSGSPAVTRIRFEILNRTLGETANIHIRELTLVP